MTAATAGTTTTDHRLEQFDCFGTTVTIRAEGPATTLLPSVARARALAFELQRHLSRFDPSSELCRLNSDPRERVPSSAVLRRFAAAVAPAGERSGGLVDATCLPAVEAAGYRTRWAPGMEFRVDPAGAGSATTVSAWHTVRVEGGDIVRPPGVRLDSGGLGKGLAADLMVGALSGLDAYVVDCGGDLRAGGRIARTRTIHVLDPVDQDVVVHGFALGRGAVATSGTLRRRWRGGHHLIDPRTGRPADTGVVQVTALAPTCLDAEVLAKAALLAGPSDAARTLAHGGVVMLADGCVEVVPTAL